MAKTVTRPPRRSASALAEEILALLPLLGRMFHQASRSALGIVDASQLRILLMLRPEPRTLTALAGAAGVRLPTMSRAVSTLSAGGLVETTTDESDRRRKVVRLTSDGQRTLASARTQILGRLRDMLGQFSRRDQEAIGSGVRLLRRGLGDKPQTFSARRNHR